MKLLVKIAVGVVAFRVFAPVVLGLGYSWLRAHDAQKGREPEAGRLTP